MSSSLKESSEFGDGDEWTPDEVTDPPIALNVPCIPDPVDDELTPKEYAERSIYLKRPCNSELDMVSNIERMLHSTGWRVRTELQPRPECPIADIVAFRRGMVWVIEAKKKINFNVLAQILYWKNVANFLSVVVPDMTISGEKQLVISGLGVGILTPTLYPPYGHILQEAARNDSAQTLLWWHAIRAISGGKRPYRFAPRESRAQGVHQGYYNTFDPSLK